MRLVTFNLHHGRSQGGQVDLDLLSEAIRTLDPDLLGLQEVDAQQPRSYRIDLTAAVAETMAAVDHRFVPALAGTPTQDWAAVDTDETPEGPTYGIALLSRYPVRRWDVLRMPGVGPHLSVRLPLRRSIRLGEEPRVAVIAEVDTPVGSLTVATTHLSFLPGWNTVQLRQVAARLDRSPGPAVLMGDLNLPGGTASRVTGYSEPARLPTFPAGRPRWQLDHVLLRGDVGTVRWSGAVRLPVSDHQALVVDLDALS